MSLFFSDDAETSTVSPPPVKRKRYRWLRRSAAVVAALVVVSLAASAVYVGSVSRSFSRHVVREELLPPMQPLPVPDGTATPDGQQPAARPKPGATGAVNYVLMGSDSRDSGHAGAGRSDTLMVVHLAADRKNAYLISFPRDMYVSIPGHGKNKINAAFAFGGAPLTVRTLEGMLDTRMDHVALVDFDGFINLTEELGGVTVVNKHASASRGYDFPAGEITIRGDRALAYVRERYELPNGDLDRAERQRDVVKAILDKGLSVGTLSNPSRFTGFVAGVAEHLTVDSELTDSEIRSTGLSLRLTSSDVKSLQAPISGFATIRGQSVDVVDRGQLKQLATALHDDDMAEYVSDHPPR